MFRSASTLAVRVGDKIGALKAMNSEQIERSVVCKMHPLQCQFARALQCDFGKFPNT